MRKSVLFAGLLALAGMGFGAAAFAQGDVIAQRRAGLKRMGEHMQAIKAVSDARGDSRPLVAQIDDMLAWYRGLPALFPAGSGTGDTKALPAIWSDRAGFETANANMVTQLQALRTAAAAGDAAAFTAAFNQTGQTCGACHRSFRAR